MIAGENGRTAWCWRKLLPLLVWIALILWVASRPKAIFSPAAMKTIFGIPKEFLQYPYHFGAYFVLAILFHRSMTGPIHRLAAYKPAVLSFLGCAAVSLSSELLQFYVPTRTPAVRDLAVDQAGAMLALLLTRQFSEKIFRFGM